MEPSREDLPAEGAFDLIGVRRVACEEEESHLTERKCFFRLSTEISLHKRLHSL